MDQIVAAAQEADPTLLQLRSALCTQLQREARDLLAQSEVSEQDVERSALHAQAVERNSSASRWGALASALERGAAQSAG